MPVTAEVTPPSSGIGRVVCGESRLEPQDVPPIARTRRPGGLAFGAPGGCDRCGRHRSRSARAPAEKAVPFEEAPRGVIEFETAAAVVATHVLGDDQRAFFDRMRYRPGTDRRTGSAGWGRGAGVTRQPGPLRSTTSVGPGAFVSKSQNSPFAGMELTGRGAGNDLRGSNLL